MREEVKTIPSAVSPRHVHCLHFPVTGNMDISSYWALSRKLHVFSKHGWLVKKKMKIGNLDTQNLKDETFLNYRPSVT
jgi:hypothetical protein